MPTLQRRTVLLASLSAGLGLAARTSSAAAETYPARTITLVIPYAVGGPADTMARALAEPLGKRLGQTVVVEGKGGGAATIGTAYVARAPADGYTLLLGTSAGHVVTPLMQHVNYDGVGDFAFIGVVASQPSALVVHPSLGVHSVAELVALAKKEPDRLNYASAGTGGATHLGAEMFLKKAGIQIVHVPYSGAAPALKDLLAGQVQMGMLNLSVTKPFIDDGKLIALAYGGAQRSPLIPDVPTLAEAGMGGSELATWYTLAAPKGTPPAVIDLLNRTLTEVQKDAAWQKFLQSQGGEEKLLTPGQTTTFVETDRSAMKTLLGSLKLLAAG